MKKLVFTALLFILAGCGQQTRDGASPAPGSTSPERSTTTATDRAVLPPARIAVATSAADPELPAVAIEAAFASADPAVKRSCARALMAYQIGDYHGAVREFESFAEKADLTAEQKKLVDYALETARKMAATTPDSSSTPQPASPASEVPGLPSLDPALQESIARAKIALKIGDYPKAVAELADIANSPQLTAEQRKTVQALLAEARRNLPQDLYNAAKPPVKK